MGIDLYSALENTFDEVSYIDFYRDIFPEGSFEEKGVYVDGKYNGIAVSISPGEKKAKRYTITDDLEKIDELAVTDDFCIISPISYIGKSRKSENARNMYAMAIDLDGIETLENWQVLMTQIEKGLELTKFVWGIPRPTYLVASGTGLHIYYVFDEPIPLFKNIVKSLEKIKKRITWQAWTQGASNLSESVQYESLFQGFRMVGSITKKGTRTRAFKVGNKVNIQYLNQFVPEEYQIKDIIYKSKLSLEEAKNKYPEWYNKRVIEKKPRGTWTCKTDLYNWWIRKLKAGAHQGHRYWCIMTLAIYAKKCGVSRKTLEEDAYGLIPFMNSIGDEFTEDDVLHALDAFDDSYITYPIHTIESRCDIKIERNKRNYRKQEIHLMVARAVRDALHENWREGNGRPDKEQIVREWREAHPDGKKAECIRETGLDKKTVYKWWVSGEAEKKKAMQPKPIQEPKPKETIQVTAADGEILEIDAEQWQRFMEEAAVQHKEYQNAVRNGEIEE